MIQTVIKKGVVSGESVGRPQLSPLHILIRTTFSCISAGTELSSVKTSGTSLIKRALTQPDNVKQVLEGIKQKGFSKIVKKVQGELSGGKAIGYSLSGVVEAVGDDVRDFMVGDRVTASGAGYANHAELVTVPVNLVAKIPANVSLQDASTATLGAIAMQGVRRADLKMGEFCVVYGSGILGLLSVQILVAGGIRVAAVDINDNRLKLASMFGAELALNPNSMDIINDVNVWTAGMGADAVLFCAATSDSGPLSQSFKMCGRKGRVVLVGVSGMEINRADIYKKELDFMISTSYGPGRYDDNYEVKGNDYPYAYVRWTENRNIIEYLRMIGAGKVHLDQMINRVFPIAKVTEAYESFNNGGGNAPILALLEYTQSKEPAVAHDTKCIVNEITPRDGIIRVGIVGCGSFAVNTHLPNLAKLKDKFSVYAVMDRKGLKSKNIATQFGAKFATTDYEDILNDRNIDLVLITTRHDSHAEFVLKALKAGKNVFVEKPLSVNYEELELLKTYFTSEVKHMPLLFVGYNRRFSLYATEIKKHTKNRISPLFIRYGMNAGYIPLDHWVHESGGRIIGEACHIIDLMTYFTESEIESIAVQSLSNGDSQYTAADNKSIVLKYKDGSVCVIDYFATGSKKHPKEVMELHFDGKTITMNDYKTLDGKGINIKPITSKNSQKGQFEELLALYDSLTGKSKKWPIEYWELIQTSEISFTIE